MGSVVRGGVHVASTGLLTLAVGLVNHVVGISKGGVLGAVLGAFIVAVIGKEGRVAIKLLCLFGKSKNDTLRSFLGIFVMYKVSTLYTFFCIYSKLLQNH